MLILLLVRIPMLLFVLASRLRSQEIILWVNYDFYLYKILLFLFTQMLTHMLTSINKRLHLISSFPKIYLQLKNSLYSLENSF